MKKNFILLASATIMFAMLFSACKSKKTNTLGRYIPQDAGLVMHINGESLTSKLSWDEIKKNSWYEEIYTDTANSAFIKSILDNPENTGVNVKGDLILFYLKDSSNAHVTIEGTITDEAKFKKMLTEANKDGKETIKDGFTYFTSEKASIAYNKEKFVATMDGGNTKSYIDYLPDSSVAVNPTIDLAAINTAILALAEDKSMAKNDKFSLLLAEKGDAHFWLNAKGFTNGMKGIGGAAAMVNLDKIYDGAITMGTINFDNGKINIDAKSYAGKEVTELYKKYNGSSVNKEMIQNIPSQNLAGVFIFNFKPEGIKEFLKILNLDGLATMGLSAYGFTLDDFIKANKGDVLFAVTDIKKDTGMATTLPNILFATSIGEKTSFNKLIDAGKKLGGGLASMSAETEKITFNTNDKYFIISNNKTYTDTYLAGTAKSVYPFMDKAADGPFCGYANLQYIISNIKPMDDSLNMASQALSLKMWDNIIISGGAFKDEAITQHWEINLMDKTTNSLKQMNTYANEMSIIEKKKSANRKSTWENEEVLTPLPTTKIK